MEIHGIAENMREQMAHENKTTQKLFLIMNMGILLSALILAGFNLDAATNASKY